jgi:hypothetical protein
MKTRIVKASELGECWAPIRFLHQCEKCDRVEKCKLPEATIGRMHVAEQQLLAAKIKYEMAGAKVAEATAEVMRLSERKE